MRVALVGISVASIFAAASAQAQVRDWRPMGFAAQGKDAYTLIYLDVASVRKTGANSLEMTTASVYPQPKRMANGTSFDWSQSVDTVDCAAKTTRTTKLSPHSGPAPILTADYPGKPIAFSGGGPVVLAAQAACSGQYAYLWQGTPALLPHAHDRFAWRAQLQKAMTAQGWYWYGAEGVAPSRTSTFVHRGSIVTEPSGTRLVTTITITQKRPNAQITAPDFYPNIKRIDCRARTWTGLYGEPHGMNLVVDPAHIGVFAGAQPVRLEPANHGELYAPVCSGDWTKGRAVQETTSGFRAIAFTLK